MSTERLERAAAGWRGASAVRQSRRDEGVTWSAYAVFCGLGLASRLLPAVFLAFVGYGLAFPLVWAWRSHDLAALGWHGRNLGPAVGWGTIGGIGAALATWLAFGHGLALPPLWPLQVAVGVPIWLLLMSPFQELFFRGWLQPRLEAAHGRWQGLLLASAAFTLWHAFPPLEGTTTSTLPLESPLGIAATFALGLLFGYLLQRTRNLAAPWLAHALAGIGLVLIGRVTFITYTP